MIPARFASTRLPGKVLVPIVGRPMIQHVWEKASTSGAGEVVIATDDERVAEVARSFGAVVLMTARRHRSGTERVAEVAGLLALGEDDVVVNVQARRTSAPASPGLSGGRGSRLPSFGPSGNPVRAH